MCKSIISVLVAAAVVIMAGCANKVPNYANSPQNLRAIKTLATEEKAVVGIIPFTAKNEGEAKVMCRLATPVGAPDGMTFAKYIEDALSVELEMGNMLDPKSQVKIGGHIEELYGSTTLGNAYWEFKVKVTSSNGKSFDVASRYDYESSFSAYSACSEMQRSYLPAVQQLVNKIVTDPSFKTLLKS